VGVHLPLATDCTNYTEIPTQRHRAHKNAQRFSRTGQIDWAALCSHERDSSIVVFRGGDPKDVAEIAVRPEADFLQTVTGDQIGFSRAISAASPEYIRELYRRYGGPTPPSLTHAGINDAFVGKGSIVWYWHEGRWLQLTGAD
jgi:hypothetical protein